MKKISVFVVLLLAVSLSVSAGGTQEDKDTLVIYAYDSFVSEWGPAGKILPAFEEETGITVDIQSAGDAGQVLSRAILEAKNPRADIILGIDNNLLDRALKADILKPYKPKHAGRIPEELRFDPTYHVIPFDYGFFSIVYDSERITLPPESLEDLTRLEYSDKLILMDPRTSSPGLGFLLWTIEVYGDGWTDYWKRLKPSILTITAGWDAGYGLFTAGEAPMVLSYTTSPAYHVEFEGTDRYKAAIFDGGNYMQIEGMGIVKGAPHRKEAERFIDFMLTDSFQKVIPLTNFMFPVVPETGLPESFDAAPKPETILLMDAEQIASNLESWLEEWVRVLSE